MITDTLTFTTADKVLMVMGEMDISLRPDDIPTIHPFQKLCMDMKEAIVVAMMEEVDIGLKIPATILLTTAEKLLMVMGEVDIGLIPATPPPIIQLGLVYC